MAVPSGVVCLWRLLLLDVLTLIWLQVKKQPKAKITNHAWHSLRYVIPTLPMVLAFSVLYEKWGFWPTLAACLVGTMILFGGFAIAMKKFGINLL